MKESVGKQVGDALHGDAIEAGFFGSVVAGILLGWLADRWLGTDPWLVVTGLALGSYAGFARVWASLKAQGQPTKRDE